MRESKAWCCEKSKLALPILLYIIYNGIAVWRVTETKENTLWWLLMVLAIVPLACKKLRDQICPRKTGEKWIVWRVVCFLPCAITCIILLEVELLKERMQDESTGNCPTGPSNLEYWARGLEQSLIIFLVFDKWIYAMRQKSHTELSVFFLDSISAGAGKLELIGALGEGEAGGDVIMESFVLAAWSWSLIQFCVTTAETPPKPTAIKTSATPEADPAGQCSNCCAATNIWAWLGTDIVQSIIFEDGPFLIARLVMFGHLIFTGLNVFFTLKNLIVVILLLYRVYTTKRGQDAVHARANWHRAVSEMEISVFNTVTTSR